MQRGRCFVGCAGWSLTRDVQDRFPPAGSHLERYAQVFPASEINSSFHRGHAPFVWRRWADSVPEGFVFSVKVPKTITHDRKLVDCEALLDGFMGQATLLGTRLGCLLVQLPPSLAFDGAVAGAFLAQLRDRWKGQVALEPRHASWFSAEAEALLVQRHVARVLADPVRHAPGAAPGGWPSLVYVRLHGSPRMYYSAYDHTLLEALARRIAQELAQRRDTWCIFDNTAAGAATHNALALLQSLRSHAN